MRAAAALLGAALFLAAQAAQACMAPPHAFALPGSITLMPGARLGEADRHVPNAPITAAWFAEANLAYGHRIMGDVQDADWLVAYSAASLSSCNVLDVAAGPGHVFEDVAPRLADVNADGKPEVVTVRSSLTRGAQLAIYGDAGDGRSLRLLAATPPIGQRHRWLAPAAVADLDGDGAVELAYVDRPHLARVLRVWRYRRGALEEVARLEGVTNHRIGDEAIAGGLRDCGAGPEVVLASPDWSRRVAVRLTGGALAARDLGPWPGAAGALAC